MTTLIVIGIVLALMSGGFGLIAVPLIYILGR